MLKKLITVGAALCLIAASFMPVSAEAAGTKDYTIMIILNGSDLESDGSAGTDDLKEMMQVGSDANINIIVQTGGTQKWHTKGISDDSMQRWYVENGSLTEIEDVGSGNIGDAGVISDYIVWGIENYPAEKYALFFWDHGAGPIGGYGYDENYDDSLFYMENVQALQDAYNKTNVKFEVIGYDCCLMGSLEYAALISKYGSYFIASEELEPGHGWDYTGLFGAVQDNPKISGDVWGKDIIDSFFEQAKDEQTDTESTLSLIDTANIDNLMGAFDGFIAALRKDIDNTDKVNSIIKARLKSEDYGAAPDAYECVDTVDLWDLADNLSDLYPNEAQSLKSAIENAVLYSKSGRDKPSAKGVSLYWPAKNIEGFSENYMIIENIYDGFGVSSEYMMFLNGYSSFIKSGSGVEYADDYGDDYEDDYDDYGYDDEYYEDDYNDEGLFAAIIDWLFGYDDDDYDDDYGDEDDGYYEDEEEYDDDGGYYEDEEDADDDDGYYEDEEDYDEEGYSTEEDDGRWDGYYDMEIGGQTYEVELYVQGSGDNEYVNLIYVYADPDFYSIGSFNDDGEWVEEYRENEEGEVISSNRSKPASKNKASGSLEDTIDQLADQNDEQAKGKLVDSDKGLSLYVEPESLDIIDQVYFCVGEVIDSPKDRAIILGLDTDVQISDNGKIFAEVYEGWEMLNGEFVPMYELSYDEDTNTARYGIPVKLNGVKSYIIVVYSDEFSDGEITGARKINERGLPDKQLIQIKAGDEVIPYYEYEDLNGDTGQVLGNKFVVEDELVLGWQEFPPGEYVFGFEIVDIYQNRTYTDFVVYEYDENGVVKMDGPSLNVGRLLILISGVLILIAIIIILIKVIRSKKRA